MKPVRVCLVTASQPSANPRLVKEADALVDAGYHVTVIGAHWQPWATAHDEALLQTRGWTFKFLDWRETQAPWTFWKSRLRHRAARSLVRVPVIGEALMQPAVGRVTPELTAMTRRVQADLYVAHNIGALPAAASAARRFGAKLGFDAEDYHRGQYEEDVVSGEVAATRLVEERLLPVCDFVTAASPGIAAAYAQLWPGGRPTCLLNVFPLSSRPALLRPTAAEGPLRLYWFSQTIGPRRGLEDVVRAMGQLPPGSAELRLQGRWDDGFARALEALAVSAGVSRTCIVSEPPIPADQLVAAASRCDVGLALEPVTPVNSDILLSNKIFTYVLGGAAIAATATSAQRDLAEQIRPACKVYAPGDASALARILRQWMDDRSQLGAARAAAWHAGSTRFNWDVEKRRYLEVIAEVLGRKARVA